MDSEKNSRHNDASRTCDKSNHEMTDYSKRCAEPDLIWDNGYNQGYE